VTSIDCWDDRASAIKIAKPGQPPDTLIWKLEAALYCEPCSGGRHYSRRQRAQILSLTYARPDLEPTKQRRDEV
jgi:hypothetical protein